MSQGHGVKHQRVSLRLAAALLLYAESGNLGNVLQAPYDVILSRGHVVQPDIIFVEKTRSGLIGGKNLWGAPDIAIDILPQETQEKRNIYSRFRVKEYWIVDPESETVEVLLWSELGYATAGIYRTPQRLSSPTLPNLRLPVSKVFADIYPRNPTTKHTKYTKMV